MAEQAPVFLALREKTTAAHMAVEARMDFLNPAMQRRHYAQRLAALHDFISPIESSISAYGDDPRQWIGVDRRKRHWLQSDLQALNIDPHSLTLVPPMPAPPEAISALGRMYVIEGSTLGGQHIVRGLMSNPAKATWPRQFFQGYGRATGPNWQNFRAHLAACIQTPAQEQHVVEEAVATFDRLAQWVEQAIDPID